MVTSQMTKALAIMIVMRKDGLLKIVIPLLARLFDASPHEDMLKNNQSLLVPFYRSTIVFQVCLIRSKFMWVLVPNAFESITFTWMVSQNDKEQNDPFSGIDSPQGLEGVGVGEDKMNRRIFTDDLLPDLANVCQSVFYPISSS
jgi:hypothetical protein